MKQPNKIPVMAGGMPVYITLRKFDRLLHEWKLKFNPRWKVWTIIE